MSKSLGAFLEAVATTKPSEPPLAFSLILWNIFHVLYQTSPQLI